jgi:hypothetical protein
LTIITSIIVIGLFILMLGTGADNDTWAIKYTTQTVEQVDNCGNYELSNNVACSNFNLNSEHGSLSNNITLVHQLFLPFP